MRFGKHLIDKLIVLGLIFSLNSCRTIPPQLDYETLAHASIQLGIDINNKDNHKLYLESAKWIGVTYQAGGRSKRGIDCSGLTCQLYKEVYRTQLSRHTNIQKQESSKVTKRRLREGDLVFFGSNISKGKVAHVGVYLKDGKFIHASTSLGVIISMLNEPYYKKHWIAGGRVR